MRRLMIRLIDLLAPVLSRLPGTAVHLLARALRSDLPVAVYDRALSQTARDFEVETRYGFRISGNTRDVIQRTILVRGVWEPQITHWTQSHLRPGDVVLDVGANCGYFSLLAAARVGNGGEVIAVEPVPTIRTLLERNLALNPDCNVTVAPLALGATDTLTEVFRAEPGNLGNSSTVQEQGFVSEGTVECVRGDSLVNDLLGRLRLIKVDTEGDEQGILSGLEGTLRAMPVGSAVLVEITPDKLALRGHSAAGVWKHFPSETWTAWTLRNDYDFSRYGVTAGHELRAITERPRERADVVFVKR